MAENTIPTDAQKTRRMLFAAVLVGFAVRVLVVAFTIGPFLEPDQTQYAFGLEGGRIAAAIARGEGFSNPLPIPTGPSAWRAPVYPYLMAGFFKAFGIHTLAAAIPMYALNCLLAAITAIPLFHIGKIAMDERVGRWAAWIWTLFPFSIVNSTQKVFDTALAALLVAWLLLDTLRMRGETRPSRWIWHGLLWGFAILTHTGVLLVLPFWWAWLLWYRLRGQLKLAPTLLAHAKLFLIGGIALLLSVAPWMVRNFLVFGKFVPFRSNLALELYVGNRPGMVEYRSEKGHPTSDPAAARRMQQLGEVPFMEEKKQEFLQFVKQYPGEFVARSVRRFFHYWTSAWDLRPSSLAAKPFETANIPFSTLVSLLGLMGLWQVWKRDRMMALPYALFLAVYPLVFYATHVSYRYRHPVDPLLVVLAAAAVAAWKRQTPASAAA